SRGQSLPKPMLTASKTSDIYFLDCREKIRAISELPLRQWFVAGRRLRREVRPGRPSFTWEDNMKTVLKLMAGAAILVSLHSAAAAEGLTIGVSWSNFQEERWKTDEAAIKAALEASGDTYISADA